MEKLGAATLRLLFPRNSTLHDLSTAIWVQSNTLELKQFRCVRCLWKLRSPSAKEEMSSSVLLDCENNLDVWVEGRVN